MRALVLGLTLILGLSSPCFAMAHYGAANPNLTEMDPYQSEFYSVCSTKKVFSSYTGPLFNVRRQTDGATEDVYPTYTGWPSMSALVTWSQGSQLFVTQAYDQTGNGNPCSQTAAGNQPTINLLGTEPTFHFDGESQNFQPPFMTGLVNGVPGLTSVMVRKKDTLDQTASYGEYSMTTNLSVANAQLSVTMDPAVSNQDICEGRRVSSDGLNRVTSSTTAFPPSLAWQVQTCAVSYANAIMTYQTTNANTITKTSFATAGTTAVAAGFGGYIGAYVNGAYPWSGDMTLIGFAQAALSSTQTQAWTPALADLEPTISLNALPFMWGNSPRTSSTITTQAPGFSYHIVAQPDGTTPNISDINSFQYHHHTRISEHNGRIWVAYSGNQNTETDQGMSTFLVSSTTHFATTPAPIWVFPQQSAWGDTSSAAQGVLPRAFVVYGGNLYLTGQITTATGVGMALIAVQCNDDGTIGTPFIIAPSASVSYASYTANPGYPQYTYNAALGPALYALSSTYGQYDDGTYNDPWHGIISYAGTTYCERGAVPLDNTGLNIAFMLRVCSGNGGAYSFYSVTHDGDQTESNPVLSTIPGGGAPVTGVLLPDGEYALVGNPLPNRGSQYLALFNPTTGAINNLYYTAVCATITGYTSACAALYPATGKSGGPSYGGLWVDTDDGLLIGSFSMVKESIIEWEIPLSDL